MIGQSEAADFGLWGLAASGLMVAVAVVISLVRHLGVSASILWASARMLVQLLIVGVALRLVVDEDDPLVLTWLWVAVIVLFASWTVGRRASEVPAVRVLALVAFSASTVASLGVLLGFGAFAPTGRAIVPLTGMVVGNSLATTVLASRRTLAEAAENVGLIEARLALGMSSQEAFAPHVRAAIRDALIPQIERTKAVGVVMLPGAMVGLILAGVEPGRAVLVQAAVMYLVLGSVATSATVMTIGISRRLFTGDHRLAAGVIPTP